MAFYDVVHPALPHLRAAQGASSRSPARAPAAIPRADALSVGPKGTIEALVRALAVEEGRFGVRANCVGPGMLTDGMAVRLRESGDLDDAALEAARRQHPDAHVRHCGRPRRGGVLPRLARGPATSPASTSTSTAAYGCELASLAAASVVLRAPTAFGVTFIFGSYSATSMSRAPRSNFARSSPRHSVHNP